MNQPVEIATLVPASDESSRDSVPTSDLWDTMDRSYAMLQVRVMILDVDGRCQYANPKILESWGRTRDQAHGMLMSEVLGEEHFLSITMPNLQRCFSGKRTVSLAEVTNRVTGKQETVNAEIVPMFDPEGRVTMALFLIQDLTRQRSAEKALEAMTGRFRDYAGASSDWFWETDDEMRLVFVSPGFEATTGLAPALVLNKSREELGSETNAPDVWNEYRDLCDQRLAFRDFQYEVATPAGKLPISVSGVPVFDDDGEFTGYRGVGRDISQLRAIEHQADVANRRFITAMDSYSGSFALFDENEAIVTYNKSYQNLHQVLGDELKPGLTFERCLRIQIEKGHIPDAVGCEDAWVAKRIEKFRNPQGSFVVAKADGRWFKVTEHRLPDGGLLKTMEDITDLKQGENALRLERQRFRDFAEAAADWFWETDESMCLSYLSEPYATTTGDDIASVLGGSFQEICATKVGNNNQRQRLEVSMEKQEGFDSVELEYEFENGKVRYFELSGAPYYDAEKKFLGYRGVGRDITDRKRLSDQLTYQASHDELTGLVNRRAFELFVQDAIDEVGESGGEMVVGYVDLDQFKIVNDTLGHHAGDELLKQVSNLFQSHLRDTDIVARLGGDEFGLLLKGCDSARGVVLAEGLGRTLQDSRFLAEGRRFDISASIGLVAIDSDISGVSDVMRRADVACYSAKDLGRNRVHLHNHTDETVVRKVVEMQQASDIKLALDEDRFTLHVQPIVSLGDDVFDVHHFEVLVRMLDEQGNIVPPGNFIPAAERYGLMERVDRWVIKNTLCNFHRAFVDHPDVVVAINLSGKSVTDESLAAFIKQHIVANDIDPRRVCFEITETAVISHIETANQFIQEMRQFGCMFALDDFGSGLSSFSYLKDFPVDYLKIDGSFVREIVDKDVDRKMVESINQMGHVLGIKTIAEFVENDQIADILRDLEVDFAQGFGLGKPRPMLSKRRV